MNAEELQNEINTWEYLAEGLTLDHQQSVKLDILRKVEYLKDELNEELVKKHISD